MRLSIDQGQRRTPAPSENHPLVDLKMLSKFFDVTHQIPCRIFLNKCKTILNQMTNVQPDTVNWVILYSRTHLVLLWVLLFTPISRYLNACTLLKPVLNR